MLRGEAGVMYVPLDGVQEIFGRAPEPKTFRRLATASGDNTIEMPFPIWRDAFIQDADLELATASYAQLSTEPYQPFLDKLDLSASTSSRSPRATSTARRTTPSPQGEWGWHPRMSSRLGLYRLVQMPGSHEVIFTNPKRLADKLVEAGRD
jgi:hypothetical protein